MLADICLVWIGLQLNAPVWYYCLIGARFLISVIQFGLKMFKAGAES